MKYGIDFFLFQLKSSPRYLTSHVITSSTIQSEHNEIWKIEIWIQVSTAATTAANEARVFVLGKKKN